MVKPTPVAISNMSSQPRSTSDLGRGKPSYTDLMILAPGTAIAIEGKYTEPAYESVRA